MILRRFAERVKAQNGTSAEPVNSCNFPLLSVAGTQSAAA